MDIPRQSVARRRKIRRAFAVVIVLGAVGGITWWLSRLEPAAPVVERATVLFDEVERGSMRLEVKGTGSLVPEII